MNALDAKDILGICHDATIASLRREVIWDIRYDITRLLEDVVEHIADNQVGIIVYEDLIEYYNLREKIFKF